MQANPGSVKPQRSYELEFDHTSRGIGGAGLTHPQAPQALGGICEGPACIEGWETR